MISNRITKKTIKTDIYCAECKFCKKSIESDYLNMTVWNLKVHEDNCSKNKKEDVEE